MVCIFDKSFQSDEPSYDVSMLVFLVSSVKWVSYEGELIHILLVIYGSMVSKN